MEKKQLNFSAPLISARRYSSPLRSSGGDGARNTGPTTEQPEMNMGEVVKPGSVPFVWEQIPGKAKSSNGSGSGSGSSRIQSPEEVPSTPKLPPAFLNGRKSGELNGFRTPTTMLSGELGFLKPPTTKNNNRLSGELNTLPPRPQSKFLSGELNMFRSHTKLSGELGILSKYHYSSFNSSEMIPSSDHSDNDDNDDANTFSDAHDTFSQLESSSVNCSISGVSGSDRLDTKHCHPEPGVQGSVEPRTRDFMMNRFLPAAKAMTLEPSQYASSRKQLAVVEQPKVVPRARTPPPGGRNVCHIVPYTGQDIGAGESDDEEEEETESGCEEKSAISVKIKACGFLPWFCSKNSIRLLNPLPSMKSRSKSALSSASRVGNLVKNRSWKSSSPKLPKHVPCVNHKNNKVEPSFKSCELQKPPKYTPRPMFYSGELPTTRSGSPYRNSSRRTSSPYRTDSPHHNNNHTTLYQKGVGVLSVPKRVTPCDENRAPRPAGPRDASSKRFDHQQLRKKEETMYIDSVNIAKVSHSILNLPKTNRSRQADNHHEARDLSRSGRLEIMKARGMSGPLLVQRVHNNNNNNKYYSSELTNTCRELVVVGSDDDRGGIVGQSPLINPPLPKSPSESWLSRKLPAVSPRNSVSYSKQTVQSSRNNQNAKWENIVKSSHSRHDLGRYSEELVTHVPQRQQTWK